MPGIVERAAARAGRLARRRRDSARRRLVVQRLMRPLVVVFRDETVEPALLGALQVAAGGRAVSAFSTA